MCSVAGIISKNGPLSAAARAEMTGLLAAQTHRGPDSATQSPCGDRVILGSNRLRITDAVNPAADMPMTTADGVLTVVFNGEIYNFRDLKQQLSDYPFRTQSDTEVLMAAYLKWGLACLSRLEGMYAFAIYDARTREVFTAVDPTGQKTIYIHEDENAWVFASEMDALMADRHRAKSWNQAALGEFAGQRFILGNETHVNEITKCESGTWARFSGNQKTTGRHFHVTLADQDDNDAESAAAKIKQAVEQGCARTFNLEVPYGLLLSGGIDSTVILALAQKQGLKLRTYSVGFRAEDILPGSQSVFDEFAFSRALAQSYGTDHTEITLNAADYIRYLDRWTDIAGEPLGSQEAPCLTRLFEQAQYDGMKVMFSGSGPDEVFDGYSYGRTLQNSNRANLAQDYFDRYHWAGQADFSQLLPHVNARGHLRRKFEEILAPYKTDDTLQAVQLLHFHGRLGAYEFRQLDLISMRHSIEARAPLADGALVAAAFTGAPALKKYQDQEKGIYKYALRDIVPPAIATRKKQGFPIPAEMWFSRAFEERAEILFDRSAVLTGCGLIDRAYLKKIWNEKDPATRNLFSRLYTAEKILQRQAPQLTAKI